MYDDGSQVVADFYKDGGRGFAVACWFDAKEEAELEVEASCVVDGGLKFPEKVVLKKPAAAGVPAEAAALAAAVLPAEAAASSALVAPAEAAPPVAPPGVWELRKHAMHHWDHQTKFPNISTSNSVHDIGALSCTLLLVEIIGNYCWWSLVMWHFRCSDVQVRRASPRSQLVQARSAL